MYHAKSSNRCIEICSAKNELRRNRVNCQLETDQEALHYSVIKAKFTPESPGLPRKISIMGIPRRETIEFLARNKNSIRVLQPKKLYVRIIYLN